MAMRHLEIELRKQGKRHLANIIASAHNLNGSDIPLSSASTTVGKPVVKTPETTIEIKRFSQGQRLQLAALVSLMLVASMRTMA